MNEKKQDIESIQAMVTDIKSGVQGLSVLTQELVNRAREYTMSPEKYRELLDFGAQFHKYSFNNCMLIMMQNPHATYVGSFKHFKELGHSVKKGEHGMKILVPVKVQLIRSDGEVKKLSDATTEEKMRVDAGELTVFQKMYFKPGTVFDISQTDVPQEDYPKFYGYMEEKPDSAAQYQCMATIVDEHGIDLTMKDLKSISLKGYYQPADDRIVLNDRLNNANRVKTLTHEFSHALLHKNGHDMPKAQIEFEAESTAYIVLRQIGANLKDYQFDYIGQYFSEFRKLKDADLDGSLKRITKTANYISATFKEHMEEMKDVLNFESEPQEPEVPDNGAKFKNRKENTYEESPLQ